MKKFSQVATIMVCLLFVQMVLLPSTALAQEDNLAVPAPSIDKSPLDISYYPDGLPLLKVRGKADMPLAMRAIYSRPQKNGREVFGGLVKYNEVWRLGANEATELEFYTDVTINKTKVNKGRYTLYVIPTETTWTFIINKETDIWGAYKYEQSNDVVRMQVPVENLSAVQEYVGLYFEKSGAGVNLVAQWDKTKAALPISL